MSQVGRPRRRHRHERLVVVIAIVAAVWSHLLAVGAAATLDLLGGWGGFGTPAPRPPRTATPTTPLDPSCDGDALLVAAARAVTCTSPFVDDRTSCLVEVG